MRYPLPPMSTPLPSNYTIAPASTAIDFDALDFSSDIDEVAAPPYDKGRIVATNPVKSRIRRHLTGYYDHYRSTALAELFVLRDGDTPIGFAACSTYLHGYAALDEVSVDRAHREKGLGAALVDRVVQWARDNDYEGVRGETQHDNLRACALCERKGFTLGGFDQLVYATHGIHAGKVALYWYLRFGSSRAMDELSGGPEAA